MFLVMILICVREMLTRVEDFMLWALSTDELPGKWQGE